MVLALSLFGCAKQADLDALVNDQQALEAQVLSLDAQVQSLETSLADLQLELAYSQAVASHDANLATTSEPTISAVSGSNQVSPGTIELKDGTDHPGRTVSYDISAAPINGKNWKEDWYQLCYPQNGSGPDKVWNDYMSAAAGIPWVEYNSNQTPPGTWRTKATLLYNYVVPPSGPFTNIPDIGPNRVGQVFDIHLYAQGTSNHYDNGSGTAHTGADGQLYREIHSPPGGTAVTIDFFMLYDTYYAVGSVVDAKLTPQASNPYPLGLREFLTQMEIDRNASGNAGAWKYVRGGYSWADGTGTHACP